jgi:hypothetical protein
MTFPNTLVRFLQGGDCNKAVILTRRNLKAFFLRPMTANVREELGQPNIRSLFYI